MNSFYELVCFDFQNEEFISELKRDFKEFFVDTYEKGNILFLNNIPLDVINKELGMIFEEETTEREIAFTYKGNNYIYSKNVYMNTSTITRI